MPHRLTLRVTADLDEIWEYLIRQTGSEAIADRQIDAITNRIYLLSNQPRLGRARDEDFGRRRRSFSVGDCIIVYRIVGNDVQFLRIVHGRRNLGALFGH
jgi:toxin ParE1/3/4